MTAWLVTAAALFIAAAVAMRSTLVLRGAARLEADRMACEVRLRLADAMLARSASAAVRLMPDGTSLAIGAVPEELTLALAGTGPLARQVEGLRDVGRTFAADLSDPVAARVIGTLEGSHPTIFVERLPGVAAVDGGTAPADRLAAMLARLPHPTWVLDGNGRAVWANPAYSHAVAGAGVAPREGAGEEPLLDANAARQLELPEGDGAVTAAVQTIVRGERRHFEVTVDRRDDTLAALAIDLTRQTEALGVQQRALQSHAATFDHLATAIAIYGPDRRLAFHNAAFQTLWQLPSAFLESAPREEEVLERLRAAGRLPTESDMSAWRREQMKGHETRQGVERWWHLPDGQSLRVVSNPGADGGITYVFENVTEQLALERRYNVLSRLQSETIDNLGEGIANFGPDGLMRLANPAFWELCRVTPADVGAHVRLVAASAPGEERAVWDVLVERVTGLTDRRTTASGRIERAGGQVLDYAFSPLPDGSTLATLNDVTDSVNIARALQDRNDALVAADELKNAFIQHVSYELRSPLNTILGFTQLLTRPQTGELNERQRDYARYISTSSQALIAIIDSILDLATIDAGIMELELGPIDVEETIAQVLEALKDRLEEGEIGVDIDLAGDARGFEGDAQRVRQVIFNLLSNAISHSPHGGAIAIGTRREGQTVALVVRDEGPGIEAAKAEAVFERFMTDGAQGRRGGVGLGLSLVKSFVELHGGSIALEPQEGSGAAFVVRFPSRARVQAAEAA